MNARALVRPAVLYGSALVLTALLQAGFIFAGSGLSEDRPHIHWSEFVAASIVLATPSYFTARLL